MTNKLDRELNVIIQNVLQDYAVTCGVAPFSGKVIIAENMAEAYLSLRSDCVENGTVDISDIEKYHGLTVQPKEVDGKFTILLNKSYIVESTNKKNVDWLGTLVHEAVHVNDFTDYFRIVCPNSYDELYDYNQHRIFQYWTEFHARAIGHYFLRKRDSGGRMEYPELIMLVRKILSGSLLFDCRILLPWKISTGLSGKLRQRKSRIFLRLSFFPMRKVYVYSVCISERMTMSLLR